MLTLRNHTTKRALAFQAPLMLVLLGGAMVVPACGSDTEDCAQTQTCITRNPDAGAGGEDNQGGTAGASGGASGSGSSSGGSSGSGAGQGGSSGSGSGGTSAGGMTGTAGEGGEPTGGTGGAGSGGEGGSDTEAPRVVSVYPADGATGIQSYENIVVTFSEPMDHDTTEAAFQSLELVPANFSWNASSTVLTVDPVAELDYAESTDPSVSALPYNATLSSTAEDESGNQLPDAFKWTFRTLRRITQTIPVVWSNVHNVSSQLGARNCASPTSAVFAGDTAENYGEFILVSVDISSMPAGATIESSSLSGEQTAITGDPYALGNLYAYGVTAFPPSSATWGMSITGNLVFSNNATLERKTLNVNSLFQRHYIDRATRNNLSQFRLSFDPLESDLNNDADLANFRCGSFSLTSVYTLP